MASVWGSLSYTLAKEFVEAFSEDSSGGQKHHAEIPPNVAHCLWGLSADLDEADTFYLLSCYRRNDSLAEVDLKSRA